MVASPAWTPRGIRGVAACFPRLTTIAIVLWLLGLVTGTMLGGFIYILLVVAVILFLIQLITGRRPV